MRREQRAEQRVESREQWVQKLRWRSRDKELRGEKKVRVSERQAKCRCTESSESIEQIEESGEQKDRKLEGGAKRVESRKTENGNWKEKERVRERVPSEA
jgi:hypothetical protein